MAQKITKAWHFLTPADKQPIVEECKAAGVEFIATGEARVKKPVLIPCPRIDGDYCTTYAYPGRKWYQSKCPFAFTEKVEQQGKVNPLKASKRAATGSK